MVCRPDCVVVLLRARPLPVCVMNARDWLSAFEISSASVLAPGYTKSWMGWKSKSDLIHYSPVPQRSSLTLCLSKKIDRAFKQNSISLTLFICEIGAGELHLLLERSTFVLEVCCHRSLARACVGRKPPRWSWGDTCGYSASVLRSIGPHSDGSVRECV